MQTKARTIDSQTGISRKIGGMPELITDTLTIADHRWNPTDLKVKVLGIIGGSIVDAEVVNAIDANLGGDRSRCTENPPDTEHQALWDTGAEKSFVSEEVYRRDFSYRPRQKTNDRVVTAQGAPCCHLSRVELQIRIREFQKTWGIDILNNMQYQCILGIDFMKESKLTLDFDKKSLIIPDDQIKQLPKMEKPVEIDLSKAKFDEGQKQILKDLFNIFKGLFSYQLGLTHVLYHEIDTGDQGPVVSRPSSQAIANALFENYISRYGAPISLISVNGPQFISEVFEHLSHRLDIKHIKTVTYRPQANLTDRVNRTLLQMIACFIEENHNNWDRFLPEFAFAQRTSVNETTVNIDQVRVYHPRQSDTISSDSHVETLYEGHRSSNGSSRSHPGKSKRSRKTSSEESKGRKSNKGNAGLEDPRLKRKVRSNGSVERTDKKLSKICWKRSLQRSEHGNQKRPTPIPTQGIKKTVPSSISSRKHKYKRPNNPSQGPQSIAGPSHQLDTRQCKPPTEGSRQGASVQYDRARKTKTTPSGGNSATERRPVRSRQA
ncbi:uncharacterized protein TNCV_2819441 [Trichonephila clavipes]|nr:uncharacterized protein TNCV_2819441 [Trichonephila clavipes]